ncbi:multiple monosaccharide ABC transporter membrane protein [Clostridium sp. USBA 49]|uniref:multiple monosaccharide ABC transporter permease n=1 Tax=Clostridium sp. USBA 49 TaxID=1881060 RepID=UPI00099B064A|nr:multiple monosaccharide ABC transporter permease [Clostridium sp. USBA 49]SKA83125.1 multiple monosaccharide ABC transporter membrane protein [Clostridium sp. USBA 49]
MENLKDLFKKNIRQYGMLIALISIMIFFQIVSKGTLLRPLNITNLILQNSYILVLAIGMLLVIVAFQIDLSVGSTAAFIGAVSGILMVKMKLPVIPSILICLAIGAVIGAWQGFWVAYVKIPAFIVTLAGMLIFRGLTMVTLNGTSMAPFPKEFQKISSGFVPDIFHGKEIHITTIIIGIIFTVVYILFEIYNRNNQKKYNFEVISQKFFIVKIVLISAAINAFTITLAKYKGIPNVLILLFILILIYSFVASKTILGRHIYALGGNEKAARLSGVKTKRNVFLVFVNMGMLAALSGLVFTARLNAATPKAGTNFELDAIAACYIGGASASGGVGTIIGAIIGGLVMGVMNNGMSLMGIGIDWQQAIKGLVLLIAVAFDIFTKSKNS